MKASLILTLCVFISLHERVESGERNSITRLQNLKMEVALLMSYNIFDF